MSNFEEKLKQSFEKQNRLEKELVKAVKNSNPDYRSKSLVQWVDTITVDCMRKLKVDREYKGTTVVEQKGMDYARSIRKHHLLMKKECKNKTEKEKIRLVNLARTMQV